MYREDEELTMNSLDDVEFGGTMDDPLMDDDADADDDLDLNDDDALDDEDEDASTKEEGWH
jgi:hypothetical protein